MDEALLCPECMRMLTAPVKLRCSHSYCLSCADRLLKTSVLKYQHSSCHFFCPLCSVLTVLHPDSAQPNDLGFESNPHLESALKLARGDSGPNGPEESSDDEAPKSLAQELKKVLCSLCDRPAENECLNCSLPLCERCSSLHRQNERVKGHKILSYEFMREIKQPVLLDSIKSMSQARLQDEMVGTKCVVHPTEDYSLYSMELRKFYCAKCLLEDAADLAPSLISIEKAVEQLKKRANYEDVEALSRSAMKALSFLDSEADSATQVAST
ncbi:MAG: B-box zinc finger protein [Candidatus Pacebacteria bacterium]|nr:B-box zinc finger protein [Candidatus Paceibacterota bacterium]